MDIRLGCIAFHRTKPDIKRKRGPIDFTENVAVKVKKKDIRLPKI